MSLVPCEPTGSSFSTPGFTPGSLPVLLPIPGPPQSHSITLVQTDLLIVSIRSSLMVSLHHTLSLSPLIALLRRGPSDETDILTYVEMSESPKEWTARHLRYESIYQIGYGPGSGQLTRLFVVVD